MTDGLEVAHGLDQAFSDLGAFGSSLVPRLRVGVYIVVSRVAGGRLEGIDGHAKIVERGAVLGQQHLLVGSVEVNGGERK